jgi:hypothetical protein
MDGSALIVEPLTLTLLYSSPRDLLRVIFNHDRDREDITSDRCERIYR